MSYSPNHKTTFLVSVFNPPVNGFFQGYCFNGTDFIFGEDGARKYQEEKGKGLSGGLDGCYVNIEKSGVSFRFDTDYAGYKVLYYYHDGELWCVSNSIARIVDFLRENKVEISPNYAHLAGITGRGSASHQLFSFETIVRGVRLVPRARTLIVTPQKAFTEAWPSAVIKNYETGLADHLHTWVSRYETLMLSDRTDFTIDVTGGVDSRTNFGLAMVAKRRLGHSGIQPRLNCGSTRDNREDLIVAEKLTSHFRLELNDSRRFTGFPLQPNESYTAFRDLNIGAYYPFYLPVEGPSPDKIHIGGGGGEIHRKFYENHLKTKDPRQFYESYAQRIEPSSFQAEFIRDAREALSIATPSGADPLRAHYREFRHRFHVGRSPRYAVAFTPLDSVSADLAQSKAGPARLDEGQFNYDVLHSLEPELLEIPFDLESKAPSKSVAERLTRVSVPTDANPGQVWAAEPEVRSGVDRSKGSRMEVYNSALEEALDNPFVKAFWPASTLARARELMDELLEGRSIGNAVNGKPISAILAADLVAPS